VSVCVFRCKNCPLASLTHYILSALAVWLGAFCITLRAILLSRFSSVREPCWAFAWCGIGEPCWAFALAFTRYVIEEALEKIQSTAQEAQKTVASEPQVSSEIPEPKTIPLDIVSETDIFKLTFESVKINYEYKSINFSYSL